MQIAEGNQGIILPPPFPLDVFVGALQSFQLQGDSAPDPVIGSRSTLAMCRGPRIRQPPPDDNFSLRP